MEVSNSEVCWGFPSERNEVACFVIKQVIEPPRLGRLMAMPLLPSLKHLDSEKAGCRAPSAASLLAIMLFGMWTGWCEAPVSG